MSAQFVPVAARCSKGVEPLVLSDIYQTDKNIVIWQRDLSVLLNGIVQEFLEDRPDFEYEAVLTPAGTLQSIERAFQCADMRIVAEDVADLVDKFTYLFELDRVGVRMRALDRAMCPKFHVDRVPCRLVTTYCGVATEWLPHEAVDRTKLGAGAKGVDDSISGLYGAESDIQQLNSGDVALLKGTQWEGNEDAGLVHRSPQLGVNKKRLLLTMDFVS
jgi:hypothetical protein